MSSPCIKALSICFLASGWLDAQGILRVCADPDNLPFSNKAGAGFENRIAEIIARDLNETLEYVWAPQDKSFIESTLDPALCDAVIGIPAALDSVLATAPYYRSTYVFVSRSDRNPHVTGFGDPLLSGMRIGIPIVGDGYAPPASALARRGLSANLIGYRLNPPEALVEAVLKQEVDIAVTWGPPAGYFARHQPLAIEAVSPAMFMAVPFTFDISAGVRKGDTALKARLDGALARQCAAIHKVLDEFGVPLTVEGGPQCELSPALHSALSR